MTPKTPAKDGPPGLADMRRKRAEMRRLWLLNIGYVALGLLIYCGYRAFQKFEGPTSAVGPLPHDHPMHRMVEGAVFLAVAVLPVIVYLILHRVSRRKHRRRKG